MANEDEDFNALLQKNVGLVQAALDPDEKKFFKLHLGQESPDLLEYLPPFQTGRWGRARELREQINRKVVDETINFMKSPTVGDAQDQFPNFPIPGSAKQTMQVDRSLVPDTFDIDQLQPNTPRQPLTEEQRLAMSTQQEAAQGNPFAATQMRDMPWLQRGAQVPTPVVPDIGAGTRPLETINRDMKLPPAFQGLLGQLQHREGLRGTARTSGPSEAEINHGYTTRLMELQGGAQETVPGEKLLLERRLGLHDKTPVPGSVGDRAAEAGVKKTTAEVDQLIPSQVAKNTGDANESNARAGEIKALVQPRIDELVARTKLQLTNAGAVGQKLLNAEQQLALQAAGKDLGLLKHLNANNMLDDKSYLSIVKAIIQTQAPNLIASGEQPSFLQSIFGINPGIKVEENPNATKTPRPVGTGQTQTGIPKVEAPQLDPSVAQPPPVDEKTLSDAEALYNSMKEGEVKVFRGQKWKRVGDDLKKVK